MPVKNPNIGDRSGMTARARARLRLEELETRALLSASPVAQVLRADLVEQVGLRSEQVAGNGQAAAALNMRVGPAPQAAAVASEKTDTGPASSAAYATSTIVVGPLPMIAAQAAGNMQGLTGTTIAVVATRAADTGATTTSIYVASYFGLGLPVVAVLTITSQDAAQASVPATTKPETIQDDSRASVKLTAEAAVKPVASEAPAPQPVDDGSAGRAPSLTRIIAPLGISTGVSANHVDAQSFVAAFDTGATPPLVRVVVAPGADGGFASASSARIILFFMGGLERDFMPLQVTEITTAPPILLDARPPVMPATKIDPFELLRRSGGGSDMVFPDAPDVARPDVPALPPPPPPAAVTPPELTTSATDALSLATVDAVFGEEGDVMPALIAAEAFATGDDSGANPLLQAGFALLGVAFGAPRKDDEKRRALEQRRRE